MNTQNSPRDLFHAPLIATLKRLEVWLERDRAARIMVAQPAMEKMVAQHLPSHVKVIYKGFVGKRKTLRGRRNYKEARPVLAVWPDDNLDESSLPMVACCIRGAVDFTIADYILKVKAGDWVVFPPGVPKQDGNDAHFFGESSGRSGDVLWMRTGVVRFSGLSLWACHSEDWKHSKLDGFRCRLDDAFLAQLFHGFCDEMQNARRADIICRLLPLILLVIRSEVASGMASHGSLEWCDDSRSDGSTPIAEALAYIDGNLNRHLTIEKVAQHIAVSPATFTRYFKKETGETFGEYQLKRRMEVAETLLKSTNLTVLHICQRIGLQYSQMRKLFQRKHGLSPVEYRERQN